MEESMPALLKILVSLGLLMANANLVQNATGLPLTLPKTNLKMQIVRRPRSTPVPKAKAKAKAKPKMVISKSADDLLLRRMAVLLHLRPTESEASLLLAKKISLPVIGGLKDFAIRRRELATIGIPPLAKISRKMENAQKDLNANSGI
jgi:hypothetical protein